MKNLKIFECKDYEHWDQFIFKSPQYNFYSMSNFFRCHKYKHKLFFLKKNNEPILAFPVFLESNIVQTIPFSYYQGIHYSKKFDNLTFFRKFSWLRYSYETILDFLLTRFKGFFFDIHPSIRDVRFIIWYFDKNKDENFNLEPKYTAILDFTEFDSLKDIRVGYRKDRIQDLRYSENQDLKFFQDCDCKTFIDLYQKTYQKNNQEVSDNILDTLEYFFFKMKNNMEIISLKKKNRIVASQLLFHDYKSVHAVAQVSDFDYLKYGVSSHLTDRLIECSFKKKVDFLDFNGCNSPNRADFKHSFGAKPKLFFRISSGVNYV